MPISCLLPHCRAGLPHSARTLSFCLDGVTAQNWTSSSQVLVQGFLETSGRTSKPATELPCPMERRESLQPALGERWCVFRKKRADSKLKSVGCVSHGRRLVMNTKESQNYQLQPTSSSRGVSIRGCDSAKLLPQAIAYQSQVATKTICGNRPLLRWVIALPPWFFITTILLSHKMLTSQETRKLQALAELASKLKHKPSSGAAHMTCWENVCSGATWPGNCLQGRLAQHAGAVQGSPWDGSLPQRLCTPHMLGRSANPSLSTEQFCLPGRDGLPRF